ncbi:hypothetical protein Pcinc_019965 [Petrolisthes cinctipes]|uniref:Uncharacterized protein n=1 Tax=Petrolisthes cinctipes TaxID=88211 RepID=A0AAE1FNQ1_PETCI|nr:hypothetical protein Pcinc_019965 [Petrolisthes cinctipes]
MKEGRRPRRTLRKEEEEEEKEEEEEEKEEEKKKEMKKEKDKRTRGESLKGLECDDVDEQKRQGHDENVLSPVHQ